MASSSLGFRDAIGTDDDGLNRWLGTTKNLGRLWRHIHQGCGYGVIGLVELERVDLIAHEYEPAPHLIELYPLRSLIAVHFLDVFAQFC